MSICAARFAAPRAVNICAASVPAVFRCLHPSARPNDVELELMPREGYELVEDGASQHPGTRPGTGREDVRGYSLSERGVMPGDGRLLSSMVAKTISSNSIRCDSV